MHIVEINDANENVIVDEIHSQYYDLDNVTYRIVYLSMDSLNSTDPFDYTWYPSGDKDDDVNRFSCWGNGEGTIDVERCTMMQTKITSLNQGQDGCNGGRYWGDIQCNRLEGIICEK